MKLLGSSETENNDYPELTREIWIRGTAGKIRLLHYNGNGTGRGRPVVFLPGWGTTPEGFSGFFKMLSKETECFYLESREKNSSILPKGGAAMDMDQNAYDLRDAIMELGLHGGRDYVLMGTCWGSTIISHTLARGLISPPTTVIFDPMPKLWFPRWLLNTLVPVIPVKGWTLLRPLARDIALLGMQEQTQRKRAEDFINNADLKKWKDAALSIKDYNLFDMAPLISEKVYIFSGVSDKIHDQSNYPKFSLLVNNSRYFKLPIEESQREDLLGLIAREFASSTKADDVPELFIEYELDIH